MSRVLVLCALTGAFLFAVPIAVKDALYGVMLIEEAPGGLRFRARRLEIQEQHLGIAHPATLETHPRIRGQQHCFARLDGSHFRHHGSELVVLRTLK